MRRVRIMGLKDKMSEQNNIAVMPEDEEKMISVLSNSLYPGAAPQSVKMVLDYCVAAKLDVMQKPVHIVPMWNKKANNGRGGMIDTIMPGIGLYRTGAARTGEYAGVSEPEFGPDIEQVFEPEEYSYKRNGEWQNGTRPGFTLTIPLWCKITVKRLLKSGIIAEFTAIEYWHENYATAGKDSLHPNAMWRKRKYGQIAKCTEAQGLRKAFPELGAAPIAEEMEGKSYEEKNITAEANSYVDDNDNSQPIEGEVMPKALPNCPEDKYNESFSSWEKKIKEGKSTAEKILKKMTLRYTFSADQISRLEGV